MLHVYTHVICPLTATSSLSALRLITARYVNNKTRRRIKLLHFHSKQYVSGIKKYNNMHHVELP
jgi:hypothetical protein